MEFIILIALVLAMGLFLLWSNKRRDRHKQQSLPYVINASLLTPAEQLFYKTLKLAVGDEYDIHCKVRLADVISVDKKINKSLWQTAVERISNKHIDFLVCDQDNSDMLCAIELDDSSRQRVPHKQHDQFLKQALATAKLPLLRIEVQPAYSQAEVADLVTEAIQPQLHIANDSSVEIDFKVLIEPEDSAHRQRRSN